jgi:hypothetical protein
VSDAAVQHAWPALPLHDWQATYATVHLWTQMLGKTRLALAAPVNHYWHTTLYVTARGLATSAMPYGERALDLELDFIAHRLIARTSDGQMADMPLAAVPVRDFYRDYLALLNSLGMQLRLWRMPVEIEGALPFDVDNVHDAYDPDAMQRCWRVLLQSARVLQSFRSEFLGKCSPVHFWWGAFDLACTRFSGRPAPLHPGGVPNLADHVTRESYSHECISAGWWPGSSGGAVAEPAYYAYAYPEPAGCATAPVRPAAARYDIQLREWILPYDAVRTAADPDAELYAFLQSTYEAAAELGGWDRAALERRSTVSGRSSER